MKKAFKMISNMEIYNDHLLLSINPKIYSLDIVYSAAYTLLDKAFIVIDGDPEDELIVEIRPKIKIDLKTLGNEFNNELINYSVYKKQSEKSLLIRQAIIQRALLTNGVNEDSHKKDDSEEILIPWE